MQPAEPQASRKTVLLLTATITPPPGVQLLAKANPAERLADYAKALTFYLTLLGRTFDFIVFAENSSSDLGALRAVVAAAALEDQVEFFSFDGLDYPPSYGRGYGDFKVVDHAMSGAKSLQGNVCVWKCTGRYVVANLDELADGRPPVDVYCHFETSPRRFATCI